MSDITLGATSSGFNLSTINSNFDAVEEVINNEVLHRTGGNNTMQQALDMNSQRILNLPAPSNPNEPARLQDLTDLISDGVNDAGEVIYTPTVGLGTPTTVEGFLNKIVLAPGAVADGVSDDTAAIQAVLDSMEEYQELILSGIYLISDTLTISVDNTTIRGPAKIIAKAGENFEYMMLGTSVQGCSVIGIEFDANQSNRVTGQNVRFMGAGFVSSIECSFDGCLARNCLGYNNVPAVGLVLAGSSIRCKANNCTLVDNGGTSGTNASDGIFTSGWQNVISNCTATNCTDTGFVIESSNFSIISGCTSVNCAAGGAITNASADAAYGNQINGLCVFNWDASNTGGIQIGVPTATSGNLINTVVSNVTMYAETGLGYGSGAAINVRNAGSGIASGLVLSNININGSLNQGILVAGDEVSISSVRVKGTTDACIQFQSGSDHVVNGGLLEGGSFGVISAGTSQVQVMSVVCKSTSGTGIYAFGTSTIDASMCIIKSPSVARYGKDGGATLNVVTMEGNNLSISNQRAGTAGSGSVLGSFLIYDSAGNTLGYVDYKAL